MAGSKITYFYGATFLLKNRVIFIEINKIF
jgi:hypothetical protein